MKLIINAFDKKTGKQILSSDIARFHFNDGLLYGILTWDEEMYLLKDLEIDELSFYNED